MELAAANRHRAARLEGLNTRQLDNSVLEHTRFEAIKAGISYISACGHDPDLFGSYGGDMIFLLRNLAHSVGLGGVSETEANSTQTGNLAASLQAAECFVDLLQSWMAEYAQPSYEMEMEEILNIVEALHAVDQLGIKTDGSLPTPTEILAKLTTVKHPIINSSVTHEEELSTSEEESHKWRKIRRARGHRFNVHDMKRHLQDKILHFDVTDMLGYDPTSRKVPLTDPKHCGHCGKLNLRGSTNCIDCNAHLRARIDYGALTDALVWTYLFEELRLPLLCNNASVSFLDVVAILPAVRIYQRIDELGHDFFRLQCYFVTHYIYVMSDWGRHMIHRELFEEEFVFILSNLGQVTSLEDPELVGEFIQCLRILGISSTDSTVWPLIHDAMLFLLQLEQHCSGHAVWSKPTDTPYDRYHTAYCAAIGLMSYSFVPRQPRCKFSLPVSRAFRLRRVA